MIATTLDKALEADFFTWFQFTERERKTAENGLTHLIYSTGMQGHQTTLQVTITAGGQIKAIQMLLERGFIDNPELSHFARDIAKSFLLAVASDFDLTKGLVNELMSRSTSGVVSYVTENGFEPEAVQLPLEVSEAYLTYIGEQDELSELIEGGANSPSTILEISNITAEQGRWLSLYVVSNLS